MRRRLRERSEHFLMQAAIREHGTGVPGTVKPYRERGGLLWRLVFVPLRGVVVTGQPRRHGQPAQRLASRERVAGRRRQPVECPGVRT